MKKICLVIFICTFLIGCSATNQTISNEELADGTFIVTPTSLFNTDELKRLEPHLDMRTGCVEIQYKGDKERIEAKYDIWENGVLKESYGNLGVSIALDDENKGQYTGLVSISIKDNILLDNLETAPHMVMTTTIEGSSSRKILDRYDLGYGSSVYNLNEPLATRDTEEVAVWALVGIDDRNGEGYSPGLTIEDTVKEVDWALVLKVCFE